MKTNNKKRIQSSPYHWSAKLSRDHSEPETIVELWNITSSDSIPNDQKAKALMMVLDPVFANKLDKNKEIWKLIETARATKDRSTREKLKRKIREEVPKLNSDDMCVHQEKWLIKQALSYITSEEGLACWSEDVGKNVFKGGCDVEGCEHQ